jgi:2-octaprenyl-6-methoxyphenol hydroxylase
VVAGAGLVGLAAATAIRLGLGEAAEVIVCDPGLGRPQGGEARAYAIAAGPRRMLEALGVWARIEAGTQAIHEMRITDSRVGDAVRPTFLTFAGEVAAGEPFAHMAEAVALAEAMRDAALEAGVRLLPRRIIRAQAGRVATRLSLDDATALDAALLIAADGKRSPLREAAGIGWVGWSYAQTAIVATVRHARDHEGRAIEHFLPSGPFAILPLPGNRSSIVWSEDSREAQVILSLDEEHILAEMERRFGLELGEIALDGPVASHPLGFGMARAFRAQRLALVGDAAHVVHPIAGQGVNLGFADAAALAERIVDAARLGLDAGAPDVLEEYERARRFDVLAMGVATDGLNRLFSTDIRPVRLIRDLGLGIVDRLKPLKRAFIRQAAGFAGEAPRLMRGEPI